jgi:hypothetical protein
MTTNNSKQWPGWIVPLATVSLFGIYILVAYLLESIEVFLWLSTGMMVIMMALIVIGVVAEIVHSRQWHEFVTTVSSLSMSPVSYRSLVNATGDDTARISMILDNNDLVKIVMADYIDDAVEVTYERRSTKTGPGYRHIRMTRPSGEVVPVRWGATQLSPSGQ